MRSREADAKAATSVHRLLYMAGIGGCVDPAILASSQAHTYLISSLQLDRG